MDQDTRAVLARALAALDTRWGDAHLDVHGLTFIDVGGVRVIVTTAAALPPGRRLVIHGTPTCLRRTIAVFWDASVDDKILLD